MNIKEGIFQEKNFFSELGYCCVFISTFISKYCQNNIKNLSNFNFLQIIDDKEYGDVGKSGGKKKRATVQNTKLAKIIYFLLMGEKLNLSLIELLKKDFICQGFLLCQFSTLFSEDYSLKTLKKILFEPEYANFFELIKKFYENVNTIGNFIFLPDLNNIENYKVEHYDLLLNELRKVFINYKNKNENLSKYIDEYNFYFDSDTINKDFQSFCNFNFLQDFINQNESTSLNLTPHFTFTDLVKNSKNKEFKNLYVNYSTKYMELSIELINKRSSRIEEAIAKRLGQISNK